ncbi:hypothetical protein [Sphingomonas turrisvirgatae]|uniref:Glycosyltransferase RgtA/B/C/D-like domain-containing protein n=1 Tax=Sphingomonas turrisvirgatae TaxID=1888892 RepID=A0A1E3LSG0_9SPHN|nr:hypothetical protein [Sphingomonas turrisvirgatae]ODP36125.1 hypothetical protein BFL28_06860 [Sphingomonas turrisvirgatae]
MNEPEHAERRFLVWLVAGFLLIRLAWLYAVHGGLDGFLEASEATRVALSIAQNGLAGDAYHAGQGATAHLMPLNPAIAGGVLRLFDPAGSAAHLILLAWSLAQVLCGYLLVRAVFARLGADPRALRWGSVLLLLGAPFMPQETVDFRYWEGASALCLVAANLLVMIEVAERRGLKRGEWIAIAALFALTCFVSPPAGVAIGACWAIVALRRLSLRQSALLAGGTLGALVLAFAPWALRNAAMLGEPVLTRSNFGLELAIANHSAALTDRDPASVFHERLSQVHPAASAAARTQVQAHGEVAYSRQLASTAKAWIAANPGGFARLWLGHAGEMIAPRAWQMYFTGWEGARSLRAGMISLVQLLGIAALVLALAAGRRRYWLPAIYIGVTVALYAIFQPMPRYSFAIYPFLAFLAAERAARLFGRGGAQPG